MTKVRTLDQGDRILTPERIDYYRQVVPYRDVDRAESYALFDSHEALRAKLRAAEADRADLIARRDQSLDDLRQRWEAEIAARKLVEAKLTVMEAEKAKVIAALMLSPGNENGVTGDLVACVNDRMQAAISWCDLADEFEAALAERTKERDKCIKERDEARQHAAANEIYAETVVEWRPIVERAKATEAALAERTKERDEAIARASRLSDAGVRTPPIISTIRCYTFSGGGRPKPRSPACERSS